MADQQDRRMQVPDAHGAASMTAVARLPMELYAHLRHYYCIFSCDATESNPTTSALSICMPLIPKLYRQL